MKKNLLLLSFLTLVSLQGFTQSRWGIFAGGGTTWYYGDMNDRLLTHRKLFSYYWKAGVLYRASQHFYISGSFAAGKVVGADSLAIQDFNNRRDLHFRNDIWQASLQAEYRILGYKNGNTRRVTPYLIGGISYYHFNPIAILNDQEIELQPLGTEGQYIDGDGNEAPYDLYGFNIPLGIGVEFKLSRAFAARLELVNHFLLTDYFDDLSSDYADSLKLSATPNGALAVAMASNLATGYPREGFGRGDPNDKDTYVFLGLSLLYTPVFGDNDGKGGGGNKSSGYKGGRKKKKKANCPAFD
ncbi:MAG: hypothetical protein JNL88_00500 [Bacteroidia bacterium]|nr:hypothetical protein [Bacteroidia bacterium]